LDVSKNPYRGLSPFEEEHCNLFFGRNALTQKLYEFITSHTLTVVLGASGSGKSSLVKAGLIPKLRQCKDGNTWFILPPFRPGESPFKALNNAVASVNLPVIATPNEATSSGLLSPAQSLANWFKEHPKANLLLIVDQFEELITLCRDDQERQQFLETLAGAIATYPHQLHLVLTLRSDFEPQFRNTALEKDWQTARFVVSAMTREELRQAIEEPASARVMYFDPHQLVEQLIDEVANMPGALPLLSFALSELYLKYLKRQEDAKNRGEAIDRAINQADYEELGGVTRSLTQRADGECKVLVQNDPVYEQTIKYVMLRMVAVSEGELARRRVPLSELEYPEPENQRVKNVIQQMVDARLVVRGRELGGEPYVEPAHDALVRGWNKIQIWKNQEQESLALQRLLTPAAGEWINHNNAVGFLWDDNPRILLLTEVLESGNNWLNAMETNFVKRSLQRRQNNRRRLVGTVTAVIVSLLGLSTWALIQQNLASNRAKIALARQLAAQAEVLSNQQTETLPSVLVATEAVKRSPLFETKQALRNVLTLLPRPVTPSMNHSDRVVSVAFSPDGKYLATGTEKAAYIWDVATGQNILSIHHDNLVEAVTFSGKGNYLVTSSDTEVSVWRWKTNQALKISHITLRSHVNAIAFNPDDKHIAIAGSESTVHVWNWKTNEIQTVGSHAVDATLVSTVAFSPDGQYLASGGSDHTVRIWQWKTKQPRELKQIKHKDAVAALNFHPKKDYLVTTNGDTAFIWQWKVDKPSEVTSIKQVQEIVAVAFSPDGNYLATAGRDNTARMWEWFSKREVTRITHLDLVEAVAFSSNGKNLATASWDKTARVWQIPNGKQGENILVNPKGEVSHAFFSPDETRLITLGAKKEKADILYVQAWKTHDGEADSHLVNAESSRLISYTSDGKYLARLNNDKTTIQLIDVTDQKQIASIPYDELYQFVTFSSSGKYLAIEKKGHTVLVWSLHSKQIIATMPHDKPILSIIFSSDDKYLATNSGNLGFLSSDSITSVWELPTGRKITKISHQHSIAAVGFNHDARYLLTIAGNTRSTEDLSLPIQVWEITSGKEVPWLRQENIVDPDDFKLLQPVAFSRDGKYLAVDDDSTVRVYELSKGREIASLRHRYWVNDIAFSPDSNYLVTVSGNWYMSQGYTAQVWELASNQVVASLTHEGKVKTATFSSQGRYVATIGENNAVHVWLWQPTALIEEACQRLTRNFSLEEWQQYFGKEPYHKTCQNLPVHPSLIEAGRNFARKGDLSAATAIFRRIQEIEPESSINPEFEVRKFAAEGLTLKARVFVSRGEKLAQAGKLEEATAEFKKANKMAPDLGIDPKVKARKIAAKRWIEKGQYLLREGYVDKAVNAFHKARELDPNLPIDLEAEKRKIEAEKFFAQGETFEKQGEYHKALVAYQKAQKLAPDIEISAESWNSICWFGSLKGKAPDVIYACEEAVKISPDNANFRDSRGLAKALKGDIKGAISDFQTYINSTDNEELKRQRQRWIESLHRGKNPFTSQEIKILLKQ
jgi:WD40 repeat protein/tetratricopeptide (TPR) repeat protein